MKKKIMFLWKRRGQSTVGTVMLAAILTGCFLYFIYDVVYQDASIIKDASMHVENISRTIARWGRDAGNHISQFGSTR